MWWHDCANSKQSQAWLLSLPLTFWITTKNESGTSTTTTTTTLEKTTKIHKGNIIFIYSVNKKRQCNKIYDIFMAFILKMSENNKNHIPPTSSYQIILNMFPFQSKIHSFGISVTTATRMRIRMRRYQKQFEIRYLKWCHLKILKRIASGCKT